MADTPNLLPFPFCGGKPEYEEDWDANYSNRVQCTQCSAEVSVIRGDVSDWNRRASSPAAVPEGALPPLPRHEYCLNSQPVLEGYTAHQMREYARAAVEADRAQRQALSVPPFAAPAGQHDAIVAAVVRAWWSVAPAKAPVGSDVVLDSDVVDAIAREIGFVLATRCRSEGGDGAPESGDVSADRAQQGEPVRYNIDSKGLPYADPEGVWVAYIDRAATKASAGAAAPVEPDWSDSKTLISEMWKNPLIPMGERLQIADGAVRFRNDVIARLRAKLAERAAPVPDTGIPTAGEVEKAGWISVEDARKPDVGQTVLLWVRTLTRGWIDDIQCEAEGAQVEMGEYRRGESAEMSYFDCFASPVSDNDWITHWMPLPVGPSEAKAGEDA